MPLPFMSTPDLTRENARMWHVLDDADLAKLRYALMRELSWIDWDGKPAWWWRKEHASLLAVKLACLVPREERP